MTETRLTEDKLREIEREETVYDTIRRHQTLIPVDVERLALEMGLTVRYLRLPGKVSGRLVNLGGSPPRFRVEVNEGHGKNRQRFTIAHEIAHYILHRDLISDAVEDDSLYRSEQISSRYETYANTYAADLVMPPGQVEKHYHRLCQKGGSFDSVLFQLSCKFQVSQAAIRIRLRSVQKERLLL